MAQYESLGSEHPLSKGLELDPTRAEIIRLRNAARTARQLGQREEAEELEARANELEDEHK